MFSGDQKAALGAKLDSGKIKQRKQSGSPVSYIEGFTAIEEANRIFGFGNWSTEILSMTEVVRQPSEKGNWDVGYLCHMRVTVWNQDHSLKTSYSGTGYGSAQNMRDLGGAVESAAKEADTDALKRALRHLGSQFGLALYDKDQANVTRGFDAEDARAKIFAQPAVSVDDMRAAQNATTREELKVIYERVKGRALPTPQAKIDTNGNGN